MLDVSVCVLVSECLHALCIQILVFNIFLICLLGDRYERGCYHLNLLPTLLYCE